MTSNLICSRCGFSFSSEWPHITRDEGILCNRCYSDWCGEMARCDNQAWESEY